MVGYLLQKEKGDEAEPDGGVADKELLRLETASLQLQPGRTHLRRPGSPGPARFRE